MRVGCEKNFVMERACEDLNGQVPVSLADDIGCAARSDVPVLITGAPDQSREIAFAIDRRSPTTHGSVDVIDCRSLGALARVISHPSWSSAANGATHDSILLLQEVHALNLHEQAQFERRLAEWRVSRRNSGLRIMASSSAPLFDRVRDGSFDERLYYRLNVIHMVAG
jgi:transcriptional regulator of acetoin/glycerol metabolism